MPQCLDAVDWASGRVYELLKYRSNNLQGFSQIFEGPPGMKA